MFAYCSIEHKGYVCVHTCDVLTLLAADSAVSRLKLVGGVSAHVSSILAGSLLLLPHTLGGPGTVSAFPSPLTAPLWNRFQDFLDLGNFKDLSLE
jgi:hypothetical protein